MSFISSTGLLVVHRALQAAEDSFMSTRWQSCVAYTSIPGRDLVRCWQPPIPAGGRFCARHASSPESAVLGDPPSSGDFRDLLSQLLGEIDPEAALDFAELPTGDYELRVSRQGELGKTVELDRNVVAWARSRPSFLRAILRTLLLILLAQRSVSESREALMAGEPRAGCAVCQSTIEAGESVQSVIVHVRCARRQVHGPVRGAGAA